jgi:uncharacterized protein YaiI (UPF0178 family)
MYCRRGLFLARPIGGYRVLSLAVTANRRTRNEAHEQNHTRRPGGRDDGRRPAYRRTHQAQSTLMQIWVDADACPKVIKEILFRAATRTKTSLTLIANQMLAVPPSPFIRSIQVPAGFDVADNEIVKRITAGDLVISSDLPLAAQVIERGGHVLSHRGEWVSADNIGALLDLRDFMETLRASGVQTGGPAPMSASERQAFAAHLDRFLAALR